MKRIKKGTNYVLLTLAVVIIIFSPLAQAGCFESCVNFLDQYCTGGIFVWEACHAVHMLVCAAACSVIMD